MIMPFLPAETVHKIHRLADSAGRGVGRRPRHH